jgi:hypothetical protein
MVSKTLCSVCVQPDDKQRVHSLTTVLIQEVERFNKLLRVIRVSNLIKSISLMCDVLMSLYITRLKEGSFI